MHMHMHMHMHMLCMHMYMCMLCVCAVHVPGKAEELARCDETRLVLVEPLPHCLQA